jgi:hypothetical protein
MDDGGTREEVAGLLEVLPARHELLRLIAASLPLALLGPRVWGDADVLGHMLDNRRGDIMGMARETPFALEEL